MLHDGLLDHEDEGTKSFETSRTIYQSRRLDIVEGPSLQQEDFIFQ
jgi:hypothetical protein